jgi:tetratricopeptide (TPR) repeat protein
LKNIFIITIYLVLSKNIFAQSANRAIKSGNDAYKNGDFSAAVKNYEKAIEKNPKNNIAHFNLGNALEKSKNIEEANKQYDEIINNDTDPDMRSKAFYNKGVTLANAKKLPEAIGEFKQTLRLSPDDKDARENLQKALNELKQQQQKQQQQQQQKQQQDKQRMEQLLNALREQEKDLQKQVQKQRIPPLKQPDKDW